MAGRPRIIAEVATDAASSSATFVKFVHPAFLGQSWSVRAYLLALVLGVAAPLAALLGAALYWNAQQQEQQAVQMALQLARIAATETTLMVSDTRSLLSALVQRPPVRALDPSSCGDLLEHYRLHFPLYRDLALLDLEGRNVCSVAPIAFKTHAQREWVRALNTDPRFQLNQVSLGEDGKTWLIAFAQPVFDEQGQLRGALLAYIDPLRYKPAATAAARVSPSVVVSLIDEHGVTITRSKEAEQAIGHKTSDFSGALLASPVAGHAADWGGMGDAFWGYAPIEGVPWVAVAAIPGREVLANAHAIAWRSAGATLGALALVLLWARWVSRRIARPIDDIARTARAVGEGEHAARAGLSGPAEIRAVAGRFNEMLDRRDAAERDLRETSLDLALVQEASAGGTWNWDLGTGKLVYSRRFKSLLGYDGDDENFARDFAFRECLHPDDRDRVLAAIDRHLEQDTPFDEEFRLRVHDDQHRWFNGRGLALRDDSGKAIRLVGSINDVTRRKRAEFELRESKERFELAVRGTAVGIWDWNIVRNSYYISPQYKALLGYDDEELPNIRQSFLRNLHPDDAERITAAVNAHLEQHVPYDAEYRLRCKDGSYKWFRGRGQAVWDGEGRALRMAGSVSDVTARKEAEAAMRDSEAKYRLLLETSTDAVLMVDAEGRILFASHALTDILGYDPAAVVGGDVALLQPERLRGTTDAGMLRALTSSVQPSEWRHAETLALHRDGHEIPVEVSFSELQLDGCHIFAGFLRDISARKKAEVELRRSERLFREMADSSPAFIWMADPAGKYSYVNRPWLEFTGRELHDEMGEGWLANVHPDDLMHLRRDYAEAFTARRSFRLEYQMRGVNGDYRWFLDQGVPRYDERGAFIGYLGSCVDITDRVLANERIHRLSDMYAALSQINDAIARAKNQQRLFERVCQITARFGSFVSVWIGLVDEDRLHLRSVACGGETFDRFDRLVLSLDPMQTDARCTAVMAVLNNSHEVCNDTSRKACRSSATAALQKEAIRAETAFPLRRSGHVIGVFVAYSNEVGFFDREIVHLLLDLANNLSFALDSLAAEVRRQKAEDEIRELNATLEQRVHERTLSLEAANRELEAFSYSVSHDLRAPLRGIAGFSDILMEKYAGDLDQEGREYLTRVKNASQRMGRLINDMLALARIARTEVRRRQLDLSAMAHEVVAELRQHEPERKVEVSIAPDLSVNADSGLMRSVLENLLGNAWKFTGKRELARIEVGAADRVGQRVYFVRDNGAGFNMAYAEKLFAPFQRLHSEEQFSGTGVGLATVQRIVHRHNGHIWCEAEEGEGACFYFTLAA